jgi:hypothetical protein
MPSTAKNLLSILNRDALAQESMSPERLFAVKEEMEKAEARRLRQFEALGLDPE